MSATGTSVGPGAGNLWAITPYFNPMRYQRRRANYRLFRERLNLPLVTVELAYGPEFELTECDAEVLIQLRGRDVMWQKERLLNLALGAVPSSCRKVIWTDCDIMVEVDDWSERVSRLLDRFLLVQAFSSVHHLSPDWTPDDTRASVMFTQRSAVSAIGSGISAASLLAHPIPSGPGSTNKGLAWAARRELLDRGGFYDACIVGGGDLAMVAAAYGCFDVAMRNMNEKQKEHYLAWARTHHARCGAEIGFLDGPLFHLWHGDIKHRRYRERHAALGRHAFDPFEDIAHDDNGSWRWNSDKPELHEGVRGYFASRREDG